MATNGNGTPEPTPQPRTSGGPSAGGPSGIPIKWLLIGGGGGVGVLAIVIVVVVLLVTGVFGGGDNGGAAGGGEWLSYVPGDAIFVTIADNRALFGGDVPDDYAEYVEDQDDGDSEKTYDFLDVDEDDLIIHAAAGDGNLDTTLEILQGDFDFDIIREELEDGRDCEDDDYRGFEFWECPGQEYPAVALFEKDKFVVLAVQQQAHLESVLTYKSRTPEKLANDDDSDIKRLLRQTDGWLQGVFIGDYCPVERCQGLAFALGKSDDSADMPASYALLFSSERAAAAAEGDVAVDDLLEELFAGFSLELDIEEVQAVEEFVVGTGTAEFVDPEDSRSSNRDDSSRNVVAVAALPTFPAVRQLRRRRRQ